MKVKKIVSKSKKQILDLHELYGKNFQFAYEYYEQLAKDNKLRQYKEIEAISLWRKMLTMVYETSHPWLTFKDAHNICSTQKHDGVIHSSNLCCMTGDQRVACDKGLITVKELYDLGCENKVVGINGINNASKMVMPKKNSPIVKINTKDGYTHKVTPDHKVWVVDKGWVEAQDLKEGNKLLLQQIEGMFGEEDDTFQGSVDGGNIDLSTLENSYAIPNYIWSSNKHTVIAFLRGLYLDVYYNHGNKYKEKYIFLKSNRASILRDIQILWMNFNIKTTLCIAGHKYNTEHPIEDTPKEFMWSLRMNLDDFENVIITRSKKNEISDNYTIFDSLSIIPDDDVYCLTVDSDNHAWTVNGFITKNTEISLNTKPNEETAVCFPGGTLVLTEDGQVPIEECDNKNVYVPYDSGLNQQHKFLKAKLTNQGKKNTFKIYTKDGYMVESTENHPFLTIDDNGKYHWKEVKNLQINDKVVKSNNDNIYPCDNDDWIMPYYEIGDKWNENTPLSFDFLKDIDNFKLNGEKFMNFLNGFLTYKIKVDNNIIWFSLKNIDDLRLIQLWLGSYGIDSTIDTYTLKIIDVESKNIFYNKINISDKEEKLDHEEWIEAIYNNINGGDIERSKNYTYITHIKNTKSEKRVYDLSLEEDHNFVANGLVVHNCNLASINVANHVDDKGKINKNKLKKTVKTAMRGLDNVIEINYYPIESARTFNTKHRAVGLGIMGFQDLLYKMRISYESEEAIDIADELQELISYYAIQNSHELSIEKGSYKTFKGSSWSKGELPFDNCKKLHETRGTESSLNMKSKLDWEGLREKVKKGMRNSNLLAIAPTSTIGIICGVTQSIEPMFQHLFVKSNLSGEFTVINPYLVKELKDLNLWDDCMVNDLKYYDGKISEIDRIPNDIKIIYKTAFEIDQSFLIRASARRQKWIDQAISLNMYLVNPTGKRLNDLYMLIWEKGLKSSYYLRAMGATHIKKTTITNRDENNFISPPTSDAISCGIDDTECESCQ